MPLIRVNQHNAGLALHRSPAPVFPALKQAAKTGSGSIIIMVHGFKFRPGDKRDCPHDHIFSFDDHPSRKALSWPRALGFGAQHPAQAGLGLAFGWDAKGTIWRAYARAAEAGEALARVIREMRSVAPDRKVHAIAHSLGARVVFEALHHLKPGDLGRVITLNGAEFRGAAEAALDSTAGQKTEFFGVTARENAGFDLVFERLVAPDRRGDRAMGWGMSESAGRIMLRLDRAGVAEHLARLGFPLAPHKRVLCHWSPYLRQGTMSLYAALMRHPETLPIEALRLAPPNAEWTVTPALPLPMGSNAPS